MACKVHTFPFPDEPNREAVVLIYEVRGAKFAAYHKHAIVDGSSKRMPDCTEKDLEFLCKCCSGVVNDLREEGIPVDGYPF